MTLRSPRRQPACPPDGRGESPTERAARLRREAAVIAKGHADIDSGLGIGNDELEAWLDRLDHDENAAPPTPGPSTPGR